jgi:hypothetical protein
MLRNFDIKSTNYFSVDYQNERLPVFNKFYEKMSEIKKMMKGFSTGFDEIQIWAMHHINNKPMTEILSEMVLAPKTNQELSK